jgi:hypothetical protein
MARLGLDRPLPRRDFLNGLAARAGGVAASSLFPGFALAAGESSGRARDAAGYDPAARCQNFRRVEATLSSSGGSNE